MVALSNIAQGSAAFAMMLATKDEKLKGLALTSSISAWLGITEPAMFGVNLRFRYPFFAAMIGSAIAGVIITIAGVMAPSIGVGGIPGFFSILNEFWPIFFVGMAIVLIVPFGLTFLIAKFKMRKEA
jgi:PTS system trehalose-specific IIC component